MYTPPKVILLQGPVGPFFNRLQSGLLNSNIECTRILFNAGDSFFCSNKRSAINFKGNLEKWSSWFRKYIKNNKPFVVILFGSDRPIHSIARNICKENEILALCLEEGYFRPGFVSLEMGGNNANSPLAGLIPNINEEVKEVDLKSSYLRHDLKNSFRNKCWYGFLYYTWRELFSFGEQRKLFHNQMNLFSQAYCWSKNFISWILMRKRDHDLFQKLSNTHYHMVVLQLDSDMQSRFQSNGWKKSDLINEAIMSFASFGSPEGYLIFKVHPLERGHYKHKKTIHRIAKNFGIEDRVLVIETGMIGQWIKHSKGIITINSTSGLSAIYHGVPILLLGNAIYQHHQLVNCLRDVESINEFWSAQVKANQDQRMRYLYWVKEKACSVGDFYVLSGNRKIVQNIIEIIT